MRFLSIPLLALAAALVITGCNGKSSSNSSDQTNASATAAAGAAAPAGAGASTDTSDQVPTYPGATTQAAGSSSGMAGATSAAAKVLSTDDSFDKVYAWYQQHMPAGSEKTHMTSPVNSAVFMIGEASKDQQSVTITTQGSKTMITIAHVKM
jgi:uncharacterized protein RhaS with RHS repeats